MRKTFGLVSAALIFGLAACSGGPPSETDASGSASGSASATATAAPPPTGDTSAFGPGCADIPGDPAEPGSMQAMAETPVASAISESPSLTRLAAIIAGIPDLTTQLDTAQDITVFAPNDAAFAKIDQPTLEALVANQEAMKDVLSYHVVGQRLTKDKLVGTFPTLAGETRAVVVTGAEQAFTVNGNAIVVCGNIQTSNATVYIIDTVLTPPPA